MQFPRLVLYATLVLVVATSVAACTDRPDPDGVVRVAIGEPHRLVPTDVDGTDDAHVLSALFTPLVEVDDQGRAREVAAASVAPSEGGRVWTITLREGFTFHDGEPVTADNYIDAWNYGAYRSNEQRNSYYFRRIEGYEEVHPRGDQQPAAETLSGLSKVDDRTFTVALSEPFVEFPAMLAAPAFYPLPQAAFDPGGGLRDGFPDAPVGNGPFRMVGWQPGDRIRVERYDAAPPAATSRARPAISGAEFVIYQDPARAYPDLLAGRVDVVTRIPAGNLATVESDLGDRYLQRPSAAFQFLAFPAYQEQFADPDIRRAISMAIDRGEIATGIFRGTQTPARSFVPPVVPGARADTCGDACRFDPAAARELYEQAGGTQRLTITYNADGEHREWVAATCDQLAANLPVECEAVAEPHLAELLTKVEDQQPVGILRQGWVMDYPSMASYLDPLYSSGGAANIYGYQNPQFDALVDAGAAAGSRKQALATFQRAEELLARELPVIPLRFGEHTIGHSPRVRHVAVSRLGHVDLTRIEVLR